MGIFALFSRSQHAAATADNTAGPVVFDLYLAFEDEAQARHWIFASDPLSTPQGSAELGAGASKDKLTQADAGPLMVKPGATGDKANSGSIASDATTTKVELVDKGNVNIVSDQNDAKIFEFVGQKLNGRASFTRDAQTSKFTVKIDGAAAAAAAGAGNAIVESDEKTCDESDSNDPDMQDVEIFISNDFDNVIRTYLEAKTIGADIASRLRAIRKAITDKTLTRRDIVFVLRLIAGGEEAAREIDNDLDKVVKLWNDDGFDAQKVIQLSAENGGWELVKSNDGTYEIPRFQFIIPGKYNNKDFTNQDMFSIVNNFSMFDSTGILQVPVKIGHHQGQEFRGSAGELALGWIKHVWSEGKNACDGCWAHITKIPRQIALLIKNGALKNRSAEIFYDFEAKGKKFGKTLKAISLLGTSTPAVPGLQQAANLDAAVGMYSLNDNSVAIITIGRKKVADDTIQLSKDELSKMIADKADEAANKTAAALKQTYDADKMAMQKRVDELTASLNVQRDNARRESLRSAREATLLHFDTLVSGGHMLPVQKDAFISLCSILDGLSDVAKGHEISDAFGEIKGNKDTMEFSIALPGTDATPKMQDMSAKALLIHVLGQQKLVDLSIQSTDLSAESKKKLAEIAAKNKAESESYSARVDELTRKIAAEEKISYADALSKAVSQVFGEGAREKMNKEGL